MISVCCKRDYCRGALRVETHCRHAEPVGVPCLTHHIHREHRIRLIARKRFRRELELLVISDLSVSLEQILGERAAIFDLSVLIAELNTRSRDQKVVGEGLVTGTFVGLIREKDVLEEGGAETVQVVGEGLDGTGRELLRDLRAVGDHVDSGEDEVLLRVVLQVTGRITRTEQGARNAHLQKPSAFE